MKIYQRYNKNTTKENGEIDLKTSQVSWNPKNIQRLSETEQINFNYPIQRAGGQWDSLQKSLLIHSIAGDYPIPAILVLKDEGVDYILDGKQRASNIVDFIRGVKNPETGEYPPNAFKLHEETPPVKLNGYEEEFEVAGKYFDELPEEVQNEIAGKALNITRLEDATDSEIEELFYRWNNGTPLTKQQKARAKMGVANASVISELLKHPFIQEKASFTALQRRRSDDEAVILQTMMLLDETYEIESFVADKILKYATDMHDKDVTAITSQVRDALDYAEMSIVNTLPLLKKVHLPTFLLVAKKALEEDVQSEVFNAWAEDFGKAINARTITKALVKTDYKKYTGAGSVKKAMVLGRKESMLAHFAKFLEEYKPVIEDPFAEKKEEEKPVEKPVEEVVTPEVTNEKPTVTDDVNTLDLFAGLDNVAFDVAKDETPEATEPTEEQPTEEVVEESKEDAVTPLELQEELQLDAEGEDTDTQLSAVEEHNKRLEEEGVEAVFGDAEKDSDKRSNSNPKGKASRNNKRNKKVNA